MDKDEVSVGSTTAHYPFAVTPRAKPPKSIAGQVFQMIRTSPRGCTVDDLCVRIPSASPSTVSSAVANLRDRGLIVWSGDERTTRFGRPAKVYVRRKK